VDLDPIFLSRIQFALNISFHILFPTISIALGWVLFYFRLRYTISGKKEWEYAYYFWVKVFALTFAIGVVSGITMSFQFGTNWPGYMESVGNIAGPLLGDRVSNKLHLIASFLVAFGTLLSAFWILALNSWMQTPQGFAIEEGKYIAANWLEIIFNPTFPYMFLHMVNASFLTVAFLISGVSAWRIKQGVDGPATQFVLKTGIFLAMILAPAQLIIGDMYGLNTLEHQPAKIAAVEGVWHTERGADFTLFGLPNEKEQRTDFAVKLPNLASWVLTHDLQGEIKGLNEFKDAHPPVAVVFWSFRIMVGMGILMIVVSSWSAWSMFKKKEISSTVLTLLSWMTFSGWIATLAGWYVTEIGRH